jgi:hypothetical protein
MTKIKKSLEWLFFYSSYLFLGKQKYSTLLEDERLEKILGGYVENSALVAAAYADCTWNNIYCALNIYEKFEMYRGIQSEWPLTSSDVNSFIHLANFTKDWLHLRLLHMFHTLNWFITWGVWTRLHVKTSLWRHKPGEPRIWSSMTPKMLKTRKWWPFHCSKF